MPTNRKTVMTKATELDAKIAENVKALRLLSKMTQPQVAAHLGIAYQSYQKMERPGHSFRVSTLSQLAQLYGVDVESFVTGTGFGLWYPAQVKVRSLFLDLNESEREEAIEAILKIRYKRK